MSQQAYEAFVTAGAQLASKGEHRRALNAYREALAISRGSTEAMRGAGKLATTSGTSRSLDKWPVPAPPAAPNPEPVSETHSSSGGLSADAQAVDPSFVVQQLSKAEIMVAYGQVKQAITMLKDVLRTSP